MKKGTSKPKAVRLSDKEDELIQEFLAANPFFDFSSLARTAIIQFIQNPNLKIKPVSQSKRRSLQ